jgi:anti-sigma regulatory factor (Ser/Thr protein kinase)
MVARFDRRLDSLDEISRFSAEFAKAQALDAGLGFELDLVIEELFTNAVKYGRSSSDGIEVQLERSGQVVTVVLRDFDVEPFDPTRAPEVDVHRPLAERSAGGLGIHLVRRIAERVAYDYRDRTSTITVTLGVRS